MFSGCITSLIFFKLNFTILIFASVTKYHVVFNHVIQPFFRTLINIAQFSLKSLFMLLCWSLPSKNKPFSATLQSFPLHLQELPLSIFSLSSVYIQQHYTESHLPTFWFVLKRKTLKGLKIWDMICLYQHMVDLFSICLHILQQTYCVTFLTFCPRQKIGLTKLFSGNSTVFFLMSSSLSSFSVKRRVRQHCTSQWFNNPTVIQHSHTTVPYQLMGKYSLYLVIF